ncbi:hypothetical protein N7486_007107 [Penicillium sp. IBT 16267x]|nr:hypothetical protein N7486_007107 [Penicillium sp. IBT 16267x]
MYSSWPLSGSGGRAGGGLATSAVVQCLIDAQSDKAQTGTENPLDIREKIGRTSGVTSGICHGPKAVCDWHGATRRNEKGQAMDLEVYRTEEFIVINKKLTESEFEQSDFTANGDSGSFVLDEDGVK